MKKRSDQGMKVKTAQVLFQIIFKFKSPNHRAADYTPASFSLPVVFQDNDFSEPRMRVSSEKQDVALRTY